MPNPELEDVLDRLQVTDSGPLAPTREQWRRHRFGMAVASRKAWTALWSDPNYAEIRPFFNEGVRRYRRIATSDLRRSSALELDKHPKFRQ